MMIQRLLPLVRIFPTKYHFATATLHQVNYYNVLGVESGATPQQIHKAYSSKLQQFNPALDQQTFKQVSEAFVILTSSKSRDAYDSLLKARQVSYLNDAQEVKTSQKSYISLRRDQANQLIRKKMNIDEFGRYKGGLPRNVPDSIYANRGSSANSTGQFATRTEVQTYADRWPEYNIVDSEVAESFKSFHQKDRRDRTMKQPWFNLAVDYEFFTFKAFRTKYLPLLRWWALLMFVVPQLWVFIDREMRLWEQKEIKQHGPQTKKQH